MGISIAYCVLQLSHVEPTHILVLAPIPDKIFEDYFEMPYILVKKSIHVFAFLSCLHISTDGRLPVCFQQTCEFPKNANSPDRYTACEPRTTTDLDAEPLAKISDIAPISKIKVEPSSATCGKPPMAICSLQNPISCPYNCDVRVKNERHDPTRMVDGVKWTWWQSTRFGMSSQSAAVNITFSLPKRFILTDDITIQFYDGYPDAMMVEKSSDHGVTWSPIQYYATNCWQEFRMTAIKRFVFMSLREAFSPICTEEYSVNLDGLTMDGIAKVAVGKRLRALSLLDLTSDDICKELYRDSESKRFLEFTDIRIRLIRPPVLTVRKGDPSMFFQSRSTSGHYGIKKVEIPARCQCNGHASSCVIENGQVKCKCRHNTQGSDCQLCKPLFWMNPPRPASYWNATLQNANPCLSFYSSSFRKTLSNVSDVGSLPGFCDCNGLSETCRLINGEQMCVDCRYNTEGRKCHRCRPQFYPLKGEASRLKLCQDCKCDRAGSLGSWCFQSGRCRCRITFTGQKCNICTAGYRRLENGPCLRIDRYNQSSCCDEYCKSQVCKNKTGVNLEAKLNVPRPNPLLSCTPEKECTCKEDESQTCVPSSGPCTWYHSSYFLTITNLSLCQLFISSIFALNPT